MNFRYMNVLHVMIMEHKKTHNILCQVYMQRGNKRQDISHCIYLFALVEWKN